MGIMIKSYYINNYIGGGDSLLPEYSIKNQNQNKYCLVRLLSSWGLFYVIKGILKSLPGGWGTTLSGRREINNKECKK